MKTPFYQKETKFVNTIKQAMRYSSDPLTQVRIYQCDCGESMAIETSKKIYVACAACKKQYG